MEPAQPIIVYVISFSLAHLGENDPPETLWFVGSEIPYFSRDNPVDLAAFDHALSRYALGWLIPERGNKRTKRAYAAIRSILDCMRIDYSRAFRQLILYSESAALLNHLPDPEFPAHIEDDLGTVSLFYDCKHLDNFKTDWLVARPNGTLYQPMQFFGKRSKHRLNSTK